LGEWWYNYRMRLFVFILFILLSFQANAQPKYLTPMWQISDNWVCIRKHHIFLDIDRDNKNDITIVDYYQEEPFTQFIDFSDSSMINSIGYKFDIVEKKFFGFDNYLFIKGTGDNSSYEGIMHIYNIQYPTKNIDGKSNRETTFFNISSSFKDFADSDRLISNVFKCDEVK